MTKVTKTGFGPFGATRVEHNGRTMEFAKSADVTVSANGVCVEERRLFSTDQTCFLNDGGSGAMERLPDGPLVGGSKTIEITRNDGTARRFDSGVFSVNRLEKHGEEIRVVQRGLLGDKVVAREQADNVRSVTSSDCNICKAANPLYQHKS